MSKIVCDVCGTSYADSATHCPICGCVRPSDSVILSSNPQEGEDSHTEGYTYVKGGRFSKSNVRKRSAGTPTEKVSKNHKSERDANVKDNKGDKGLIVAVCMLLLAIIAVVAYIVIHFFIQQPDAESTPSNPAQIQPSTSATIAGELSIPCTAITLSQTNLELEVGQTAQLIATVAPEDTTDSISFSSSNDTVATVTTEGMVRAVAAGDATITVTCGEISAECKVISVAPAETTAPTEITEPSQPTESTQPSSEYTAPYRLNRHIAGKPTERDATISVGESFQLKLLDANDRAIPVEWTVENSSVCSVDGNTIKGKASGITTITAVYEGVTYTCLVRVK